MKLKKILARARSTAVRQNPRPLGRGASLFARPPTIFNFQSTVFNPNIQHPIFYVYLQAIPKATQK